MCEVRLSSASGCGRVMTPTLCSVLTLAVLALGCPTPPPPVLDAGIDAGVVIGHIELCERLMTAQCELKLRCYPAFSRLGLAECIAQSQATCLAEYDELRPALEAGRVALDVAQLSSCERRLASSACPASFPPDFPLPVARPFADCGLETGLFKGAVAVGQTCDRAVECEAGTKCIKPSGVCRGTCAKYSQLGEPCGIGCPPELRCDGNLCAWPKGLDETCRNSKECEADLLCLGSCRPRRKLGESCRLDADRLSPCEAGLACDVVPFIADLEGKCVVPAEGACRFHWSCRSGLVCADIDWSTYPRDAPAAAGSCRLPDGAQFSCSETKYSLFIGDQCAAGLSCHEGVKRCQPLPQRGQACTPSKQDCSGFEVYCKPTGAGDVGVCAGPPGPGELCALRVDASQTVAIPCGTGLYCEKDVTFQCRPPWKTMGSICKESGECVSNRCVPQPDRSLRCAAPC